MRRPSSRFARIVQLLLGNLLVLTVLLVAVEGTASLLLFVRAANWRQPLAERLHTKYDAELGWVNEENVRRENMYGPGAHLTTNGRGFRGKHDVQASVPQGKLRVICSGDSFTLGYGVDDEKTWCHQLTALDSRLETVNMGQGGYGIDQAYLWYRRDGTKLQHDVQILAFITNDFQRMQSAEFLGYAKPWLALEGGRIAVRNVPVPRASYGMFSWFTRNAETFRSLRAVQLGAGVVRRLGRDGPVEGGRRETSTLEQTRELLSILFSDLKKLNEERGSRLILVHLPTTFELRSEGPLEWITYLEKESRGLGIPYVNLFEPFRDLSGARWTAMFLRPGELDYPRATGHYNIEGNKKVAALIYEALLTVFPGPAGGDPPRPSDPPEPFPRFGR